MTASSRVFMRGVDYELGEHVRPVDGLAELADRDQVRAELLAQGARSYLVSDRTPGELATASLRRTIERAAVPLEAIDCVLYCSMTFWDPRFFTSDVSEAFLELGLPRVPVLGVYLSACGKLGSAVRMAASLVRSGDCRDVLLVTTDRCPPDRPRVVDEFSVRSDAAASCLITAEEEGAELELVALTQSSEFTLEREPEHIKRWRVYLKALGKSISEVVVRAKRGPGEIDLLVTNNYIDKQRQTFAAIAGIELDRTFAHNVGRVGYAHSADTLINLRDARDRGRIQPGRFVVALSTGNHAWTCIGLVGR